jgi:hypothetical protein
MRVALREERKHGPVNPLLTAESSSLPIQTLLPHNPVFSASSDENDLPSVRFLSHEPNTQ